MDSDRAGAEPLATNQQRDPHHTSRGAGRLKPRLRVDLHEFSMPPPWPQIPARASWGHRSVRNREEGEHLSMSPVTMKRVIAALAVTVVTAVWQPAARAATPVDLLQNHDFENPEAALELEPGSEVEGTVAYTNVDPIDGAGSMKITVNDYGRLSGWYQYGWGSGPNASSVVLSTKLRVDSTTDPNVMLTVCAIAYFMDSQEPSQVCKQFPADQ